MKKRFPIILLAVASLLLAGCFSSKKATKGQRGQATILATEDPFKSTDEVTINFKKMKEKEWNYPLDLSFYGSIDMLTTFKCFCYFPSNERLFSYD